MASAEPVSLIWIAPTPMRLRNCGLRLSLTVTTTRLPWTLTEPDQPAWCSTLFARAMASPASTWSVPERTAEAESSSAPALAACSAARLASTRSLMSSPPPPTRAMSATNAVVATIIVHTAAAPRPSRTRRRGRRVGAEIRRAALRVRPRAMRSRARGCVRRRDKFAIHLDRDPVTPRVRALCGAVTTRSGRSRSARRRAR